MDLAIFNGLSNLSLYFIFWIISALWLYKRKLKLFSLYFGIGTVGFLLCSTNYMPKRLIASIEKAYDPIALDVLDSSKTYYIHVLSSGVFDTPRLPASLSLSTEYGGVNTFGRGHTGL